jgi:hypothetical protein
MLKFRGRAAQDAYVMVEVQLDEHHVGVLNMTLAEWDRLRAHETTTSSVANYASMKGDSVGVEVESD